jgi:transcriptional regulator with XRE-family HTH domain
VRNERDLTQEDLADLASINRNHIGAIERGDKIAGLTVFLKIADALEIKPSELMSACDPR